MDLPPLTDVIIWSISLILVVLIFLPVVREYVSIEYLCSCFSL